MDHSDRSVNVSIASVIIAILIPLAVAVFATILLAQAGPHDLVLAGVPRGALHSLYVASEGEAKISREEAVQRAAENVGGRSEGGKDVVVRQAVLGRYSDDAVVGDILRGRLVWVVSFANPDEIGVGHFGGPFDRDRSCDWAFHVRFVYVKIDAQTGESLTTTEGGHLDPSRPPRSKEITISDEERERCKRLVREWQRAAPSP